MRGALFILLFALTTQAFASVIVPTYSRGRPSINIGPSLGWSNRREAGLKYGQSESEKKTNGVKADETDLTMIAPYVYSRITPNLNLEVEYLKADGETKAPASKKDIESDFLVAGMGYEVTGGMPMEFGFQIYNFNYDEKNVTTGAVIADSKALTLGLHAGTILASNIYVGGAWYHTDVESNVRDRTADQAIAGIGQVFGDRANPEAAYEVFLSYDNSLSSQDWNLTFDTYINRGDLQYHARAEAGKTEGDTKGSDYNATLGLDYLFPPGIYVGPEVSYSSGKVDDNGTKTETKSTDYGIEAGYRSQKMELAVTYTLNSNEEKQTAPTVSKDENEGSTIALHGSYLF